MSHRFRVVLRLAVLLALAAGVIVLNGVPSGTKTPYTSALSDLVLGTPVLAAPCGYTHCDATNACDPNHVKNKTECAYVNGVCMTVSC